MYVPSAGATGGVAVMAVLLMLVAAPTQPRAGATAGTFHQGLWRGEDPRITRHRDWYYYVENAGGRGPRRIYRSRSLIDRGEPRTLPDGFPLFAPVYVGTLNGVTYNKWYAFDTQVWECSGDPYLSAPDGWRRIQSIPFRHWTIDHFVFRAESGPFRGQWFMVWAGQERDDDPSTPGDESQEWWFESIYISRITSLRPGEKTLEQTDDSAANRIVHFRFHSSKPMTYPVPPEAAGAWKDVVAEAPCVVQKDETISLIYSGDGAQTSHYALGIAFCKDGDVLNPHSWVDWNQDVRPGPEFAWDFENGIFGPGVARVVPSPDGREDWMFYHSKVWDTWNRADRGHEEEQQTKEMWTRFINLKKIGWKRVAHEGKSYTLPDLGRPDRPGARLPLPSGDQGVADRAQTTIEAGQMIPFGSVMSDAVQDLPGALDVMKIVEPAASGGVCIGRFDTLAAGAPDGRSGLLYRNLPAGGRLVVRASSPHARAGFDLYVDGVFVKRLNIKCTGSWSVYAENEASLAIPHGSELRLVYERGRHEGSYVDWIRIGR